MSGVSTTHKIDNMPAIKRTVTETMVGPTYKKPRSGSGPRKKSLQKKQYGQEGPEMKFLDSQAVLTPNVTGQVISMNTMAQGLTNSTRVGDKICIKSAGLRISSFPVDPTLDVQANVVKWSIVLDKEPEASALASYNQIYTGNSVQAWSNINYSDRFVILATGTWAYGQRRVLSTNAYSDGGEMSKYVDAYRKTDINSKYILTTATQTAISSNQLLFCIISEQGDANINMNYDARIRYTDE